MRNFIAILEHDNDDDEHGEICCLVQAESPAGVEEPLAELVTRLHEERGTPKGATKLLLLDIIELPTTAGNAVLWSSSWRHIEGHGFAATRGAMLLDESGTGAAHEWVHEKNRADREANLPHTIDPFIRFDVD